MRKIKTLDQWPPKWTGGRPTLASQHISAFQAHLAGASITSTRVSQRGGAAEWGGPEPFDIACNIGETTEQGLKDALLLVLREKMINDLEAANKLLSAFFTGAKITMPETTSALICPPAMAICISNPKLTKQELLKKHAELRRDRRKKYKAILKEIKRLSK